MQKVLIINGHPDEESYNHALALAYAQAAEEAGATVEVLHLYQLSFDPNLRYGYRKRIELEPDLLRAQELITWASHLVWVYPVWWGSVPALMKGFIDRTFLPGFAFKKREGSLWWDKLLTGKTARLICTLDQPPWYYKLYYGCPSHKAMKKLTMEFCGVKRVSISAFGPVRNSSEATRKQWLQTVARLGARQR